MSDYVIKGQVFQAGHVEPGLYLAATPIGNLGDITLRVLETLAGCDLVACEDTRVTGKLLHHFGIKKKMIAYHEHNAETAGKHLLDEIRAGKSVTLASDAGTPLVSDPGFRLVQSAREAGLPVVPLPGASAPITGLIASGLPSECWTFAGFLPTKQRARLARLKHFSTHEETVMFFESPNRLIKSLADMVEVFGPERQACVARELTKLHEEIHTAPLLELIELYQQRSVKGEIVILISPREEREEIDVTALLKTLLEALPVKQAAAEAADISGQSKRDLYQLALSLREKDQ